MQLFYSLPRQEFWTSFQGLKFNSLLTKAQYIKFTKKQLPINILSLEVSKYFIETVLAPSLAAFTAA